MYIETFDTQKIDKAKQRWSELNDSDLRGIGNDSERLVDIVSRKGGMDREQASREVDEFLKSCGCDSGGVGKSRDPSASYGSSNTGSDVKQDNQGRAGTANPSGSQPSGRPGTSTDDQTGEMAAAQPGRKTRPDPQNM